MSARAILGQCSRANAGKAPTVNTAMKKPACLRCLSRYPDDITAFAAIAFLLFILVQSMAS